MDERERNQKLEALYRQRGVAASAPDEFGVEIRQEIDQAIERLLGRPRDPRTITTTRPARGLAHQSLPPLSRR